MWWWKNKCYNGGKKHNFKPRYTEKMNPKSINTRGMFADDIRKLMYCDEYVCDVCVWCGERKER